MATEPSPDHPALRRAPGSLPVAETAFAVAISGLICVVLAGVVRRWRWLFWLLLVAFAAGLAQVPIAVLQLSGRMAPEGPNWYIVVQGVIGVIQVGLAVAMFAGYRRAGPWGAF